MNTYDKPYYCFAFCIFWYFQRWQTYCFVSDSDVNIENYHKRCQGWGLIMVQSRSVGVWHYGSLVLQHDFTEPVYEGRGAGEDSGLLHFIADTGGNKAGYPLNVPPTILTQTVQRTTRVSIASSYDVSSCTDHGALDVDAPPVTAAAHTVLHHGQ